MYVFDCGVSARGKPRGAKGIRGQQPCDHGFRDWFSADVTSASLPLPSSSPLSPSHSLPLSASLSLCTALLFSPLPFLSIPPLRDGVCRCCSGVRGLTCTQRGPPPPSPDLLHIPWVSLLTVSSTTAAAFQLSPRPASLCGCLGVGPLGVEGIKNMLRLGAVQN